MSVCTSVRPQKVSSISMKFGIQVVLGMTLTRIQGQGQGHRDLKVAKLPKFKVYLLRQNSIDLKTDGRLLHYRTISNI